LILRHKLKVLVPLIALVAALGFVAGCGGDDTASSTGTAGSGGGGTELTIVGYSVAREVNADLIKAFQATPAGEGVTFKESYAASGEQSRAVAAGLSADYVVFSLEPDMTRLVDAGLVDSDWNAGPHKGMVSDSVVVFITRKGNPKGIKTWDDLTKDGVDVITPNPFTSGAAQWNILAAYQAQIDQGKTPDEALQYVDALFKNVPVQPASGREALQVFSTGQGDVLLSYENEAIKAQSEGEDVDYVIPDDSITIQTPIAVTKDAPKSAQKFLDFIWSDEGQKIWADNGYRPVNPKLVDPKEFPAPEKALFKIAKFGGWAKVKDEFFDEEEGSVAKIEQELGVSTSG
jgi:sulfate/thiosulfate transport system substrate-binding protein